MKHYLNRVTTGEPLSREEMRGVMDILLSGNANDSEIAGFLMAMRMRAQTSEELAAGVEAMRSVAIHVDAPPEAIDTCGTGGDGADTFNISTAVAFVVAGAGIPVAKHGSTASSSRSGSAEVLRELGVNLEASPDTITRCISEAGVGFMFAAVHHRAVKNVMAARKQLGVRTLFNVLGPLSNPAAAKRQLMGVYDPSLLMLAAETMKQLGVEAAWVVHGADGLDELSTTGINQVAALKDGKISRFEISPEDAGILQSDMASLKGGDPAHNANAIKALLSGEKGSFRDITVLNAAAALVIADHADTIADGAILATRAIDQGAALTALDGLVRISNTER